jgi:hypothetical protein
MTGSLACSVAARPAVALTAAPVYSNKQGDVTFVMPIAKRARNSLRFNWPFSVRNVGGTRFPPTSIDTYDCDSGYGGDKPLLVIHCQIR